MLNAARREDSAEAERLRLVLKYLDEVRVSCILSSTKGTEECQRTKCDLSMSRSHIKQT